MVVVDGYVHAGLFREPSETTCFGVVLPSAVPEEVVHGDGQGDPSTHPRASPQVEIAVPVSIGQGQIDPTGLWLEERLRLDRLAISLHIDQQHKALLSEYQKRSLAQVAAPLPSSPSSCMHLLKTIPSSPACSPPPSPLLRKKRTASFAKDEEVIQSSPEPESIHTVCITDNVVLETEGADSPESIKTAGSRFFRSLSQSGIEVLETKEGRLGRLERLVEGPRFELLCVVIIFLNAISIALEMQYNGQEIGCKLGFEEYSVHPEQVMPWAPLVLDALDKVFVAIFTAELFLRLVATRKRWFYSLWNYLDLVLIILAIVSWSSASMMNPTFVRLVRLGKLVRIIRVMRSSKLLESLKLLSASIHASYNTLCLSFFVIILVSAVAGMLLSQLVEPYILDTSKPEHVRKEVFAYYGTFWRSMITMFEITFANWAPTCRLLVDNVSEYFGIFFLLHRCVVGFAMLSVIQAVFIQQTMKSAQLDEDFMVQQKGREKETYATKLRNVFQKLDVSGDGELSWEEFNTMVSDNHMKLLMNTLEVDVRDMKGLFHMLEDADGRIKSDEFVAGLQRIRGPAQSLDMVNLLSIVGRIETRLTGSKSKSFLC